MTRAAFNTTCDLFYGPGTGTPGALIGTFDCRLVSDAAILIVGSNAPSRLYYLTIQAATPVGVWSTPLLSLDASLADRVAVPSGTDPRFMVLFTEQIDWHGQAIYQRANLIGIPTPTTLDAGLVVGELGEEIDAGLVVGELGEEIDAGLVVGELGEEIDAGLIVGEPTDELDAGLVVGELGEEIDAGLVVGELGEEIDAGLVVGELGEEIDAGLVVGELGEEIDAGLRVGLETLGEPGSSCGTSLELPLGSTFSGTTVDSHVQWFRSFVPAGTSVFLHLGAVGASWQPSDIKVGTSCEDALTVLTIFSGEACWDDVFEEDRWVYFAVALTVSPCDYTFTIGEGTC